MNDVNPIEEVHDQILRILRANGAACFLDTDSRLFLKLGTDVFLVQHHGTDAVSLFHQNLEILFLAGTDEYETLQQVLSDVVTEEQFSYDVRKSVADALKERLALLAER